MFLSQQICGVTFLLYFFCFCLLLFFILFLEFSVNLHFGKKLVVINSTVQHNFHGAQKGGGLLTQRVSFQTSCSSGCKQYWGRNQCRKINFSRFHHDSANPCEQLVSDSPLQVWDWNHNKLRASLQKISEL